MSQLSLFPNEEPGIAQGSLFLAIFPDADTAHDIYELGAKMRGKNGLSGRVRPLDHLHVSLPGLGNEADLIQVADRAWNEIASITPTFSVTFDRVMSFKGQTHSSNKPLVLVGREDGNIELKTFHRLLIEKLSTLANRGKVNGKFNPHVTLLYGRPISEERVGPISWKVKEAVLVRSHVGMTKYDRLRSWAFGG